MRRIVIATLVLIPVLANAQASTSTKPSQNSATLVASATPPPALAPSTAAASSADVATSAVPMHVVIHQADDADTDANGTIEYSFGAGNAGNSVTAPKLIHVVNPDLAPQQAIAGADVTVHLTVDRNGIPQNISIDRATDPVVARKTLAAISQYRFKPATRNYLAVAADVTINVKINQ